MSRAAHTGDEKSAVFSSPHFLSYREPRSPVCRLPMILKKSLPTTPAIPTITSSRISSMLRADCHGRFGISVNGSTPADSVCWNSCVHDPRGRVVPRRRVRHRAPEIVAQLRVARENDSARWPLSPAMQRNIDSGPYGPVEAHPDQIAAGHSEPEIYRRHW